MPANTYAAFAGDQLIAAGDLATTVLGVKASAEQGEQRTVLVFEDRTGAQIDFDLRGTPEEVIGRLERHPHVATAAYEEAVGVPARRGPGRPRLGVVCREVSLLPRHWRWLEHQKGGASAAIRRLVDESRKRGEGAELARQAWNAAGKFMWAMSGNLPGFEEASRALYAKDVDLLAALTRGWPHDIRAHVERLVGLAATLERSAARGGEIEAVQPEARHTVE